ncbi:MAG TPA: methyltransferase domain-containing protein, partial [Marmoricola sp.]|nr:methyltransferase domain-containing protein [Marmoricola sp.]
DASFDVVVCSLVLHELPARTRAAVVREAVRVLAPGGRFVVVELAGGPAQGLRGRLTAAFIELAERAAGHRKASRTFLRAGGLLALARDTGLTVDKHRVVGGGTIELAVLAPE